MRSLLQAFWMSAALLIYSHNPALAEEPPAGNLQRPNIVIAMSDDQSFPHASAYGSSFVSTPVFDALAERGVLLTNAFAASPGCSPSRAALLTGRHTWMIEQAGSHANIFPAKYLTMPQVLHQFGYHIGFTGKGWGPGLWKEERNYNPAGPEYSTLRLNPPHSGIKRFDYAGNFGAFLADRENNQPFFFWYGSKEPHRSFEQGSWEKEGKNLADVKVPAFLPDHAVTRGDLADYAVEIEWFDAQLGAIIDQLEEAGELENTLIIVTSDNGMAFPRAKATAYEYGIHVPMAISWPARIPSGRRVDDLVGFVDVTATIYDAANIDLSVLRYPVIGTSLLNILETEGSGILDPSRSAIYAAREKHTTARWNHSSYPQRAIRTHRFLLIRNDRPERWPAGAPQRQFDDGTLGLMHGAYYDIDDSPTKSLLLEGREDPLIRNFFELATGLRPRYELFDISNDPYNLNNLAEDPAYADVLQELASRLATYLEETGDPRQVGDGDIWEGYSSSGENRAPRKFPKPDWAQ